jgi:hypothetical protein
MSADGVMVQVAKRVLDPESTQVMPIHSPNHAHPLELSKNNHAWSCDGATVFGNCKGKGRKDTAKRYKCTVCANFDLCELCIV